MRGLNPARAAREEPSVTAFIAAHPPRIVRHLSFLYQYDSVGALQMPVWRDQAAGFPNPVPMKKLLRLAAATWSLLCLSLASAAPAAVPPVSTTIVMPWDVRQNAQLPRELKSRGFNHATVYLNWSDIERRKGQYEFSHYHGFLDALVDGGLSLLLVLDMGGRPYKDENGALVPYTTTVPAWIGAAHPDAFLRNFSGELTWQLDFGDKAIQPLANQFIAKTAAHFSQRYPGKVLGYAIGIQEEHEIKYGQMDYQWRDYKPSTQAEFLRLHKATQPVINYNNNIAAGAPKAEPLLHAHKSFRESRLREAVCTYAGTIRAKGAQAIGYFAETFTSHDAIYAAGIVEKLTDCIDIAVIDFNFFDGYELVPDPNVLPALANYLVSLGYPKVMVGAYAEHWEAARKTPELMPVIQRSLDRSLSQAKVVGYEIGGLAHRGARSALASLELNRLHADITARRPASPTSTAVRIGILGSTTNFHVWHGERGNGRNIHKDALFAAYKLLSSEPGVEVHLIGEKNLLADDPLVQSLNAILVPHQAALPHAVKAKLTAYWNHGGALVQDMRLGEFDENGKPTSDWMHDVFGIAGIEWKKAGGVFLLDGAVYRLKPSRRVYAGYASMAPRPGYQLLAQEPLQRGQGIMVRGERTLAFGFMPQLVEDNTRDAWRSLFVREIKRLALQRSSAL